MTAVESTAREGDETSADVKLDISDQAEKSDEDAGDMRLAMLEPGEGDGAAALEAAVQEPVEAGEDKRTRLRRGGGAYKIGKPYKIKGKLYVPRDEPGYEEVGRASWYGPGFDGRMTANGEVFDQNALTAAHTTLPLPSYARVTNLKNGRSVVVRVNDRGPYANNRLADLSKKAAVMLGFHRAGHTDIKLEYLGKAPIRGGDGEQLLASYSEDSDSPAQLPKSKLVERLDEGVAALQDGVESVKKKASEVLPGVASAKDEPALEHATPGTNQPVRQTIESVRLESADADDPLGFASQTPTRQMGVFGLVLRETTGRQ
ncbi:septal ring lytic transglycosylase RlpA family protein [Notoacmeibacter ruber]|uniref:Endolytic peptidoglycan transglycosylase RlpA n=1 Tax=Notoacmeibacter ruber TaxID=2670375 RepID=A0A3L7JFI1_9HYPH|nr:septal ring lytic transglycosylase RlpA family protein [Notoacmeibacter ruber]RLQ89446.1 septal ring lytic transglycosylase RlpA family protein [Notoacmeibacter ruber]